MTDRIEDVIFENLVYNEEFARRVLPFLSEEYFNDSIDKVVYRKISGFFEQYNAPPTKAALKISLDDVSSLRRQEYDIALERIEALAESEKNMNWLIDSTEKFCRDRAITNAIFTSIHILEGKVTKFDRGAIPTILSEALSVSFDKSVGHDYFDDAEKRFEFYHLKEDRIPFDIEIFNKITRGGVPRKTLNMILAGCVHPETKVKVRIKKRSTPM